ncbi:HEAT repeat domain-containing protein [Streptomyces albidoflavus]
MKPEDQRVILDLVTYPGSAPRGTPEDVLRHFGTDDGRALGLELLREAVAERDGGQVEMALIVADRFGLSPACLEPLITSCSADWHRAHEGVVSALGTLRSPASVRALQHLADWVPDYLHYDDSRAMGVKAVWALRRTPGPEAEEALWGLLASGSGDVREAAAKGLRSRGVSESEGT